MLEEQLRREREDKPVPNEVCLSLGDLEYPVFWQHQYNEIQFFDVGKDSEEWRKIATHFRQGIPQIKIQRISRNQNKQLWMWYWLKRNEIAKKNNNAPNEQLVFHGSRNDAYDIILKSGFDHRVANMGGAIGAGVYFGVNSSVSSGYIPGKSGWKKMLYCRLTLGAMGQGQAGLRRPPEKGNGELYDSVGIAGSMYVIFDNHQAFPEYVVYYT